MDKDNSRFLLQHFGSIAASLTASEKELMETEYLTNDDCRKIIEAINLQ
jgi:ERCC4-type nuclease